jgi:hypothetical protein
MAYIGNIPAEAFSSFQKQDFTTSATTSYTLDHKVANENELALFINFVRQEAGTAYTASNNTLTLSSATSASDDMYCIYLGKAVQTVNPPSGSVGTSQLASNAVTTAKITDANVTSAKLSYPLTTFSSTGIDDNADATAITIDSSENVGIKTSSPTVPLEVSGSALIGGEVIASGSTTTTASRRAIMTHDGSSMKLMGSGDSTHRNIIFYRDGGSDEAMRIDTSNRLQVGASSSLWNMNFNVNQGSSLASEDGYNGTPPVRIYQRTDHTGGLFVEFTNSAGGRVGSITRSGSTTTAFNTSSDYRLKENVVDLDNATTRLKQLKPKRFNFIADADTTVDGFLAHEVSDIVPEAVTGEKDEVRDFGNIVDENNNIIEENVNENHLKEDGHTWVKNETKPVYQGIDQSKLVPLLVKTIQELEARITELENK